MIDYKKAVFKISEDLLDTLYHNHFNDLTTEEVEGIRQQLKKHPLVIDVLEELEARVAHMKENEDITIIYD